MGRWGGSGGGGEVEILGREKTPLGNEILGLLKGSERAGYANVIQTEHQTLHPDVWKQLGDQRWWGGVEGEEERGGGGEGERGVSGCSGTLCGLPAPSSRLEASAGFWWRSDRDCSEGLAETRPCLESECFSYFIAIQNPDLSSIPPTWVVQSFS